MKRFPCMLAMSAGMVTSMASAEITVTFQRLLPALSANDMTPDGRWIVGETDVNGDYFPDGTYRYDRLNDVFFMLPAQGINATAISDDGGVILGDMPDPTGIGSNVAARWTLQTNWVSLGFLPRAGACPSRSDGYELSADGSVAVGLSWDGCSGRGFVWRQSTGMEELEPLANGGNRASVVSADGTIVGGFAQGAFSRTPATWNGVSTDGDLMDPPAGEVQGEVYGMSDDGSLLLLGWLDGAAGDVSERATKWTAAGGLETIGAGSLLPGWGGIPQDIADDGTIVGFDFLLGNRRAWIQPGGEGPLVELKAWAESHGAVVDIPLGLHVPQAISRDGRYIVGHTSYEGAWLLTINHVPSCAGDATDNGTVDFDDLNLVLANWSQTVTPGTDGDVDC
ncbi:hypothetical protein KDL44_16205, partial [bacterium]|nr:hypothetical protein [bacterium]